MFGRVASRSLVALLAALLVVPVVPVMPALAAEVSLTLAPGGTIFATYGDPATYTATLVDPAGPTPVEGVTISFDAVPFAGGDPVPLGTAATNASGTATLGANPVSALGAGHWLVAAHWIGDTTFDPANSEATDLTVSKKLLTVTPNSISVPYSSLPDYMYVISGWVLGESAATAADYAPPTCTSAYTPTTPAGSALTITCSPGAAADYSFDTTPTATLTVAKGNQVISFGSPAPTNAKVGQTYTPAAAATSGLAVTFGASPVSICQLKTGNVELKNPGTCTVTADQGGDANWNAAPRATQTFEVTGPTATTTTVSSSLNPSRYGQAVTFTATVTPTAATGSVQFAVDGASLGGAVTVAGGTATSIATSSLPAATHTVTATFTADDLVTYGNSAGALAGGQVVTKADQAITFGPLGDRTYGDAPFTATASASSGLAVSFSSLTTDVCTVEGTTVTIAGAGTCTIRASQAGNGNYNEATPVDQAFTVAKANQAITFVQPTDHAIDESPITVSATASSGLAVTFSSQTPGVCTTGGSTGATVSFVTTGSCTIRASQAGNDDYNEATPVDQAFTVAKANQAITFVQPTDHAIDESPITVSATASSGLAVTFSSQTPGVCTTGGSTGATVSFVTTGSCTIRASQAGDAYFNAAPTVDRNFAIGKANQTITFGTLATKTYGDPAFGVSASASSGLPVTFSSPTTGVCTVSGTTVTIVGAGGCTIRASQAGDVNYSTAANVDRAFTVEKKTAVVAADDVSRRYGAADPTFTATTTGLVGADNPGLPECITTQETPKVVGGNYPITCSQGSLSTANYQYTYVIGWLSVTKAPLTVRADDTDRPYGLLNPTAFSYTYSGFVADDDGGDVDTPPTCDTGASQSSPVGDYTIQCLEGSDSNYDITHIDGTFTIQPAQPSPDVTADVNPAAVSQPITFTARVSWQTGTPTGTVTFFVDGGAVSGAIDLDVDGKGRYSTSSLSLGDHAITVVYTPDAVATNFATATSPSFTQSIGTTPVDVELTANRTTWETNVPITFTANVRPRASRVTVPITGQVIFAVDGVDRTTVAIVGGVAAYASPALTSGAHSVTARYVRDAAAETRFTVGNPGALARTVVANTVNASGVGTSSSSVYPVRDTWKDTLAIRGTRNESASVSIKIYRVVRGPDPLVRSRSYSRASGPYSYAWNGRKSSGTILPAGKYKVVQLLTDAFGAKKKYVSYVTLSTKKMTWYTKYIYVSPGPRRWTVPGDDYVRDQYSTTKTGPLVVDTTKSAEDADGWTGVGYQFTLPSASTYSSVAFQVKGSWTGATSPKIGLVPWLGGNWAREMYTEAYGGSRPRVAMGTSSTTYYSHNVTSLTGVRSGRYVRGVIDSFNPPSGYDASPSKYTISSVRVLVRYGILR